MTQHNRTSATTDVVGGLEVRVREAVASLDGEGVAYLGRVREAAARLARRDVAADDVRAALDDLSARSTIDVDVPTRSRRRSVRAVKGTVKTLSAWYLRYLSEQVTSLGHATVRLGETLIERTDGLERSAAVTALEVAQLRARLDRLERQQAGPGQADGPGPAR